MIINGKLSSGTGLASGDESLSVCDFRHKDGVESPLCWTEYYINRDFAAVGRLLQSHTGPIFPLIEDLFGQSIVEVHQEMAATLISPALAGGLNVKAGRRLSSGAHTKCLIGKLLRLPSILIRRPAFVTR